MAPGCHGNACIFSICQKRSSFDWLCTPVLCPTTGFGVTTDCSKHPEKPSLSAVGCSGVDGFCDLAGGLFTMSVCYCDICFQVSTQHCTCHMSFPNIQVKIRRNIWVGSLQLELSELKGHPLRNKKGEITAIRLERLDDFFNAMDYSVIYGNCINSFCKRQDPNVTPTFDSSGSLVTSLFAGRGITATECAEHREGILCGQCKTGYSLTMYYTVSVTAQ